MNVTDQLIRAEKGLAYINTVLASEGLAAWEIKEYNVVRKEREAEIKELKAHIKTYNL